MAEGEIAALKEALCDQYIIMKKLYIELEEEREASATAASETLSMILRLQREKAAEKMEACQYKRMAEEKMHHAEESLMILEDIMQQKEFEISFLKHQLQAYKDTLSSHGVDELDVGEMRTFGFPSSSGTCPVFDKTKFHGLVRRNISLPVFQLDQSYGDMDSEGKDSPLHLIKQEIEMETETYTETKMPDFSEEALHENCSSDLKQAEEVKDREEVWSQSRKVDQKFSSELSLMNIESRNIANVDPVNLGEVSTSCSWHSAVSGEGLSSLSFQAEDFENKSVSYMPDSSCMKSGSNENTINSVSVHDIFEIPEFLKLHYSNLGELSKQELEESISETKHMIGMPNFMPREAVDYIFKDDDWLNKAFMHTHHGNKASTPKKGSSVHPRSKMSAPRKEASVNFYQAHAETNMGISTPMTDSDQVNQPLRQLEDERTMLEQESKGSQEQMKLLREIREQLNTIESHIKKINTEKSHQQVNTKKSHQQDESSIVSIMEIWRTLLNINKGAREVNNW